MSWVSRAVDRLLIVDLLPERALRISARLLMLFDAGNRDAVPLRTDVRLIWMDVFNELKDFRLANYAMQNIFLRVVKHLRENSSYFVV